MSRYRVNLVTVASTQVEVEAQDEAEAIDLAFASDLPYAPGFARYELGEWSLASDLFPEQSDPADDCEEVSA